MTATTLIDFLLLRLRPPPRIDEVSHGPATDRLQFRLYGFHVEFLFLEGQGTEKFEIDQGQVRFDCSRRAILGPRCSFEQL